jgi:L-malate glycosyltransferase
MGKIRILYCIDSLAHDAGPDKQVAELIRGIDHDRFEMHLCCFEDCPRMRSLDDLCRQIVLPVISIYRINGIRRILQLRRYIIDNKIDIIQTFLIKANIVGTLAAWGTKCRVVSSRRNMGYWMTPFYTWLYRRLARHTTRMLANSERVKRFVIEKEHVPPEQVDVLYNPVDMAKYAPGCGDPSVLRSLGVPDDAKLVGLVANLRPVKDPALFVRAAQLVSRAVPQAAFVLVGTGLMRDELGALAANLGISSKVFFSDGRGTVQDYLGRLAVGCLSSQSEGFSNALLEYMACGLPVVATDVGGNAEAIRHGITGYVIPHGAPDALARPIIGLLQDDDRRSDMGHRALERCREMFNADAVIKRYEDYYRGLLEVSAL